jgi:hypothetical protein
MKDWFLDRAFGTVSLDARAVKEMRFNGSYYGVKRTEKST